MITAYVVGITTYHEEEDIEVRYSIYKEEKEVCKKSIFMEYKKPLIVGQVALSTLLKELEKYLGEEITIFINDPALDEQIRGTSTTKNKDVLKIAARTKEKIKKFDNTITIKDISNNNEMLEKWNEILKP